MGKTALLACLIALAAAAPARADVDAAKLRQAVQLPHVDLGFQVGVDNYETLELPADPSAELARLRASLKGDATDASTYLALARIEQRLKQESAKADFQAAVRLYAAETAAHPTDARLLAAYGEALEGAGRPAEAEKVLRRAIAASPTEWRAWLQLAHALSVQWATDVAPGLTPERVERISVSTTGPGEGLEDLVREWKKSPDPARLKRATTRLDEAARALDRAVELAPRSPEAVAGRFGLRIALTLNRTLGSALGSGKDPAEALQSEKGGVITGALLSPASLADVRRLAELRDTDPRPTVLAAFLEVFAAAKGGTPELGSPELWKGLPVEAQGHLREGMARLERLGGNVKPGAAAPALEALGILQWGFLADAATAEKTLRRAVALDPTRDQAWQLLAAMLASTGRIADIASLYEERLKSTDTAAVRLVLARGYGKLDQWEKAEAHVRAAHKSWPRDPQASLAMAMVLLRRGGEADLPEVRKLLEGARAGLGPMPEPILQADFFLAEGVSLALEGKVDAARQRLDQAAKLSNGDPSVVQALAALGS